MQPINRLSLFSFYTLLIFSFTTRAMINEFDAAGLHNALNPQFSQCSPIDGLNAWENDIVKNMCRYGDENDATIKLAKLLFHLDANGTGFHATTGDRQPAKYFTPTTVGKLLDIVLKYQNTLTTNKEDFSLELKTAIKEVFPDTVNNLKNLHKSGPCKQFPDIIIKSLEEQQISPTTSAKYLPQTTALLLTTFLTQKAPKKDNYKDYFSAFKNISVLSSKADNELNKIYSPLDLNEFEQQFKVSPPEKQINLIKEHYELSSLSQRYASHAAKIFPPIIAQQYTVNYKGESFADCGETSLRNAMNIFTFNCATEQFELDWLQDLHKQGKIKLNQKIPWFYNKYPDAKEADRITQVNTENKNPYNDWASVVSELPGVTYNQEHKGMCEIMPGLKNMLMVIDALFFQTDADTLKKMSNQDHIERLTKTMTHKNYRIRWTNVNHITDPIKRSMIPATYSDVEKYDDNLALTFDVSTAGGYYSFQWIFLPKHFEINLVKKATSNSFDPLVEKILSKECLSEQPHLLLNTLGWYLEDSIKPAGENALRKIIADKSLSFLHRNLLFCLLKSTNPYHKVNILKLFIQSNNYPQKEILAVLSSIPTNDENLLNTVINALEENKQTELLLSWLNNIDCSHIPQACAFSLLEKYRSTKIKELQLTQQSIEQLLDALTETENETIIRDLFKKLLYSKDLELLAQFLHAAQHNGWVNVEHYFGYPKSGNEYTTDIVLDFCRLFEHDKAIAIMLNALPTVYKITLLENLAELIVVTPDLAMASTIEKRKRILYMICDNLNKGDDYIQKRENGDTPYHNSKNIFWRSFLCRTNILTTILYNKNKAFEDVIFSLLWERIKTYIPEFLSDLNARTYDTLPHILYLILMQRNEKFYPIVLELLKHPNVVCHLPFHPKLPKIIEQVIADIKSNHAVLAQELESKLDIILKERREQEKVEAESP